MAQVRTKMTVCLLTVLAVTAITIFYCMSARADVVMKCERLTGKRVSYGETRNIQGQIIQSKASGIEWSENARAPVRLIWMSSNPTKLFMNSREYFVAYRSDDHIQAFGINCGTKGCTGSSVSAFPRLGLVIVAESWFSDMLGLGEVGNADLFTSLCSD
jgi:hypothetical protein